jgi:hypothetical protein
MLKYMVHLAMVLLVAATMAVLTAAISVSHNQTTTSVTTAVQETLAPAVATAAAQETPPPAAATAAAPETPAPAVATAAIQEMPGPIAVTTSVQERPAPVSAEDIKLTVAPKPATDVAPPAAEPQRVDPPAAIASTPAPVEKPAAEKPVAKKPAAEKPAVAAAKRATVAARQHLTGTRERASVTARGGPHIGYTTGF